MEYMPRLNELTLFILAGNEAALLAGNIVTSIQDHVGKDYQAAVSCFALVDTDFDRERAVVDNVFYPFTEFTLEQTAVRVADDKIREMIDNLNARGLQDRVDLRRLNCVLVVDANGSLSFEQVKAITSSLQQYANESNTGCGFQLCLLTDYGKASHQAAWLMRDGQPDEGLNVYRKVLLLVNKTFDGNKGTGVEQRMRDAVLPAMLMMLESHEQNDTTRLYTAAYNKEGGTSNDILELKRHIAAEVLDGIFANPGALSAAEVWKWLSTPDIDLTNGSTPAERIQQAVEKCVPTLEIIAATADLESKAFDPVDHLMDFDRLNRDSMYEPELLPDQWASDVLANLKELLYPDAMKAYLEEDGEIHRSLLSAWHEASKRRKELRDERYIETQLRSYSSNTRKGLARQRDYNLQLLHELTERYKNFCRERLSYRILTALQEKMGVVREELQRMIDLRQKALSRYKQSKEKIDVLTGESMCGRAAQEIRSRYSAIQSLEDFPTFLKHSEELYKPGSSRYWHDLFREFADKIGKTGSFSDAFQRGKDDVGLRMGIKRLSENLSPLLQDYPDECGALPIPAGAYLLNESIARCLDSKLDEAAVYGVPGDLLEYVAIYPLGKDFSLLPKLKLFLQGSVLQEGVANALQRHQRVLPKSAVEESTDGNPWSLRLKETESEIQISWVYPSSKEDTVIWINGERVESHYSYSDYMANGMIYAFPKKQLNRQSIKVKLECGGESYERGLAFRTASEIIPLKPCRTTAKLKSQGLELQRFLLDTQEDVFGRCLVLDNGSLRFRLPINLDENGQAAPLWLPEAYRDVEVEELNEINN